MFGWFTFVEVTARQVRLLQSIFFSSRGSCTRDPPSMIAYTSCRPLLRPLTIWSPILDLYNFCFHYVWPYSFSSWITMPYICIYSCLKFCCFDPMCYTIIYVFVKRYTIHGLTHVDMHNMQILQSVRMFKHGLFILYTIRRRTYSK